MTALTPQFSVFVSLIQIFAMQFWTLRASHFETRSTGLNSHIQLWQPDRSFAGTIWVKLKYHAWNCQEAIYWPFISPNKWHINRKVITAKDFPGGSGSRESACNAGDPGSVPGSGRFPWRKEWQPTPVFLPGESHGQRSLGGFNPRGFKESGLDWLTDTHTIMAGYY